MPKEFAFSLSEKVQIEMSGERGQVRGRAEYVDLGRQYQIAYTDSHGAYQEKWVGEDLLLSAEASHSID